MAMACTDWLWAIHQTTTTENLATGHINLSLYFRVDFEGNFVEFFSWVDWLDKALICRLVVEKNLLGTESNLYSGQEKGHMNVFVQSEQLIICDFDTLDRDRISFIGWGLFEGAVVPDPVEKVE